MASSEKQTVSKYFCIQNIELNGQIYENVRLNVLKDLCTDVIIGQDFMKQHSSVEFLFGGEKDKLTIAQLKCMNVECPRIFRLLNGEPLPIATKGRQHSKKESKFIKEEIDRLLKDDIIEPSYSPWRAQVLVVQNATNKSRMVRLFTNHQQIFLCGRVSFAQN